MRSYVLMGGVLVLSFVFQHCTQGTVNEGVSQVETPSCSVKEPKLSSWLNTQSLKIPFKCTDSRVYVIATMECRHGGQESAWRPCSSPTHHEITNVSNGQQIFEVRAHYNNGFIAYSSPFVWKVDAFAPSILNVNRRFDSQKDELAFEIEVVDSGGSGLHLLECALIPMSTWKPCSKQIVYKGLNEEVAYTFQVRAHDGAGNTSPVFVDEVFQSLRIPASFEKGLQCELTNTPERFMNERSFSVSFSCFENGDVVKDLECRLDEEQWMACLSYKHHRFERLTLGEHRFEVRKKHFGPRPAEEDLSNSPLSWDFKVDDLAPLVNISYKDTTSLTPSFAFEVSDNFNEPIRAECQLESQGRVVKSWYRCDSPFTVSGGLTEGSSYELKIKATDVAGNTGTSVATSWIAEKRMQPSCFILSQKETLSINEEQAKVDFICHGPDEVVDHECRVNEQEWKPCASAYFEILDKAVNGNAIKFQVRARDTVGRWSAPSVPYFIKD